jgi:hypothetical protein
MEAGFALLVGLPFPRLAYPFGRGLRASAISWMVSIVLSVSSWHLFLFFLPVYHSRFSSLISMLYLVALVAGSVLA